MTGSHKLLENQQEYTFVNSTSVNDSDSSVMLLMSTLNSMRVLQLCMCRVFAIDTGEGQFLGRVVRGFVCGAFLELRTRQCTTR